MNIGALKLQFPVVREADQVMVIVTILLMVLGLVMVASASVAVAEKVSGDMLYYFYRQLVYVVLGLIAGACVFMVPMQSWQDSGFLLLLLAFLLLVLVLIPGVGREVNGAQRWIAFPMFNLQASEPARLALVLYICGYIVRRRAELQNTLSGLVKPLLPISLACILLLLEPDFGAAAVLAGVTFLLLFLGGARLIFLSIPLIFAGVAFSYLATAQAYRLRRLVSFLDPFADIEDSGWQLAQSLIAIGRGEWFGVGLGNSVQKLLYLPEQYTDFIFAVYAEEFGLFGVFVLLSFYAVLVWRGFVIGKIAEAQGALFRSYVSYGLSSWIGFQALINLAVNMGMVPTKGLTLPLMSYGGSSLITLCAMIAILLRVDYENRQNSASRPLGVPA